ncbi:hypothetical protein IT407_03955 [Candidatus Uhrbacteria bacterium]|nr:hypothetical protein [Candidatus Uhrbacteria bacterium]
MARRRYDDDAPSGAAWVAAGILACIAAAVVWTAQPSVFGDGPVPIVFDRYATITNSPSSTSSTEKNDAQEPVKKNDLAIVAGADERFFKLSDGKEWNVVLRQTNGEPYSEIHILGLVGERTAVVSARSDKPVILRVERNGSIRELYRMPDQTAVVGFGADVVWVASFQPGEGLESDPVGPSRLIRIDMNGTVKEMLQEARVIVSVQAVSKDVYSYQTADGGVVGIGVVY